MTRSYLSGFTAVILILCSSLSAASENFNVVVSIKPVHSIVAGLMQDAGEPVLLIGDQQTPYHFELNPPQQQQLTAANLVIWVGAELEESLQGAISRLPQSVRVIELLASPDLKILPSRNHPDRRDPFFWMDDRNAIILLDELTGLLIELDPARAHIYARNRRRMLSALQHIDKEYEYGYRGMKAGLGVLYFDTLQYFEQAYALKTLGSVSASLRDKEDAASLLKLRGRIVNHEASCLLLDKSMPARNIGLLSAGQAINTGELDTLGLQFKAGPELYLRLMEYNSDVIKQCLGADMDKAARARLAANSSDLPDTEGIGGGRFFLTDQMGRSVSEQDMQGHYALVFFGYTSCPDVCPTSLLAVSQALRQMGERATQIQPYFISVDPERDTVERLREYVGYFDPRLTGLTGSVQMIQRVADRFGVKFEKGESTASDPDRYSVDHSASLYLMAPDGRFVSKFAYGISAEILAQELGRIIP